MRRHSTTDLKHVKSDRTVSPTFRSSTSSSLKALRRHSDPPSTSTSLSQDLSRLSYLVGKACRLVVCLFDSQVAPSTTRSTFDIETNY
ncbi:uncharacterized protein SCHCODRAFT_02194484 [Schizophyllum commune H4-8]|uniref:uncharacterized protein n=1 Tax=Schizophyllum commune (strain H4-8 / FGSC 9210) TaxID=578458 RepID=UPI002160388E|nr:uncharacterized protein SCHCODRAFT_02194484 [Schizophyllum commune H4-8]KAI5896592.1 hypothetical protein SCHCODRAFT_02194484 [Schizophyllum commune H4-8]